MVLYNQLFSFRKFGSNAGLAQKGLQIFLPISPKIALIFYDYDVYTVGKRHALTVNIDIARDIYELNTLQMCSALNCVYFRDSEQDVNSLYGKASPFFRKKKAILKAFTRNQTKYEKEELIGMSREDIRTNLTLSFVRLTKSAREWRKKFQRQRPQPVSILRNQEYYDVYEKFMSKVENGELEIGDFIQYLKG